MRILCLDDEPLALMLLVTMIKKVKPDAEVESFRIQTELLEAAERGAVMWLFSIFTCVE